MRILNKNKQKMFYSILGDETPVYEKDSDGNIIYIEIDGVQVPLETGETEKTYSNPKEFYGNISFSGGESEPSEFGLNVADYNATIVTEKGLPIVEGALIWFESERNGIYTADYIVTKVSSSLNEVKYILKKRVK